MCCKSVQVGLLEQGEDIGLETVRMGKEFSFDVSSLSYEDFVLYFFTNSKDEFWNLDPNGNEFIIPEIMRPEVVVGHMTRFCFEFRQLADGLPLETLNRGIDGMLSSAFLHLQRALWNNTVDLQDRVSCIRSMYRVFADFVAGCQVEVLEGCFFMWWDNVCTSFWFEQTHNRKLRTEDYNLLSDVDRKLVDAMFETLVEILKLEDERTKSCALHGLGHLHHPAVRKVVQEFIDTNRGELEPRGISWLEECRDGTVM
jgi:hypothetical protein